MATAKNAAPAEEPTPDVAPDAQPPADDVPVFAPAEEPTPDSTQSHIPEIPDWLAENYDTLIADPNRNDSYTKLADRSQGTLAAWARHKAAEAGEDVTPVDAEPAGPDTTRGAAEG